jgi:hypothetical protein
MVNPKTIATGATIAGAVAITALGLGAGVANADQPSPNTTGITWKLDRDDDWDDWRGPGWRWAPPPPAPVGGCAWVPPVAWPWVPPAVCGW